MNIVNIGIEKTLVGGQGANNAIERHKYYGKFVDHLDIIAYANRKEGLSKFKISNNVCGYPSNSRGKAFFFFDCLKIFKKINKQHKVDLIICQDGFVPGLTGLWLKKKYGAKLEINFHGDFWENPYWLKERWLNYIFLLISKFTVPRADAIRVVSQLIKRKLLKAGIKEKKIRIISTPVNLDKFKIFNQEIVDDIRNEHGNKKNILFVGRLVKVKNLGLLISSFSLVKEKYKNVNLLVLGQGPEKGEVKKLIKKLKLTDSIFLLGTMNHKQLSNYYRAVDILVLTSFSEGMPNVLIEGGFCGLPLISTRVSGAEEIIKDGYNGFLFPVGDKNILVEKLLILLKDEPLRQKMGIRSKEVIKNNFGDTTPKLIKFWQDIINNNL